MEIPPLVMLFPSTGAGTKYIQQLQQWLADDSSVILHEATSSADVVENAKGYACSVLIFCICDQGDLVELLECLSISQSLIKSHKLRVMGINLIDHPDIAKLLAKKGCSDILPATITQKALNHKLQQTFKILENYKAKEKSSFSTKNEVAIEAPVPIVQRGAQIKKTPALSLGSDFFLVRKDRDLRQVQGRWLVDLIGPGPSAGIWEEAAHETWVWKPRVTNGVVDAFLVDDGAWTFFGRKPEFLWQDSRWRFLGDSLQLAFVQNGIVTAIRMKSEGSVLEISENSSQAKAKMPLILKTFENEVRFTAEKKKAQLSPELVLEESKSFGGISSSTDDRGGTSQAELEVEFIEPALKVWIASVDGEWDPIFAAPIEMTDTDILVEVPANEFIRDQIYMVLFDNGLKRLDSKSRIKCNVSEVTNCDSQVDMVRFQTENALKLPVDSIQKIYEERQADILSFLKAARGW